MEFVNRREELAEIRAALQGRGAVFYRLFGRRRIGKTALLAEVCRAQRGLYLFVPEGDEVRVLAELRRQAGAAAGDALPPEGWEGLFRYLERFEGRPVVFDEFQHVLEASPTAVSVLQHCWDSRLSGGDHKWFLAGSSIGMMRRLTSGTTGPLFGRLTHDRRLDPFRFRDIALLYPTLTPEAVLDRFAIFGGTPHYHAGSVNHDLQEAVFLSFLSSASPLRDEPLELLRFELKRPARYHGILEAIGNGKRQLEEIRDYLGLDRVGDITRYIAYLRDDLGLLVPDHPLGSIKRAQRYRLADPFFGFYYRFIGRNLPTLAVGGQDDVWRTIEAGLPTHVGRVVEEVCRQLLIDRNGASLAQVPISFQTLGSWWGPTRGNRKQIEEVDVVALGRTEALIGEIRWQSKPMALEVLAELERKANLIDAVGARRKRYLLVSRGGFGSRLRQNAPEGTILLDGKAFLAAALNPPDGSTPGRRPKRPRS